MTSPTGNATDPVDVSLGNDPSFDLSQATLSAIGLEGGSWPPCPGPSLGALPSPARHRAEPASSWPGFSTAATVYYARADESPSGSWTFTSGNTGTSGDSTTYGYNDTASSSAATGSVNTDATGTITIDVPASEVGLPPAQAPCSRSLQAFDQLGRGDVGGVFAHDHRQLRHGAPVCRTVEHRSRRDWR